MSITTQDLREALPDVTTTMRLGGLASPVDVFRDPWGIPHIRASSEADLFFAQGFVTAQDRLWHMDYDRHRALGRWAELAGPAGLEQDRLLRAAGMGRTAKLDCEAASPEARRMVDAYAAGVNAFIETSAALPVEYRLLGVRPEPWESWHCVAVYKVRNTLLGTFEPKLFRARLVAALGPARAARLIRGYQQGHLLTVPPGAVYDGPPLDGFDELSKAAEDANWLNETDAGSNGWCVSGALTQSGLPLVAGDSHRALDTPSVYYQVHLACPDFSVIGHSIPGMPGALHFCHNEYVGWGMTHGGADTQDLFIERFRETAGGREYLFRDEWLPAQVLQESIDVGGGDPVPLEVTITHHGPVVAGDPASGHAVAISDPGLIEGTPWLDAARDAMRARSADGLDQAFSRWTDRVNNYVYGDVHGNFGYLHRGRIPVRPRSNGWRPVPGWTGEHEWTGYIPPDELPKSSNPEARYAVTCNQRVVDHTYPHYLGIDFAPEYRARRIRCRILQLEQGSATVDDMARIHAERISNPARALRDALAQLSIDEGEPARAQALLREWDGSMDRDLVQPAIYAATRGYVTRDIAGHLLGPLADAALSGAAGAEALLRQINSRVVTAIENDDASMLPEGKGWPGTLRSALERGIAELRERLGGDMSEWRWGRIHRTRPRHPLSPYYPAASSLLDPPSMAVHGDGDTPLAGGYSLADPFTVTGVSVNRYIHDPSNWAGSRWIVPLGASGHPASPHYADQAEAWSNVAYIPQLWEWADIDAQAETRQRLEPAG